VRVTHVMRLGTEADLKASLQGMGFSGRLNTAFIERVNLTIRHGIAALARRTWATSQQAPQLLAHCIVFHPRLPVSSHRAPASERRCKKEEELRKELHLHHTEQERR
jgi:hypothetical protein